MNQTIVVKEATGRRALNDFVKLWPRLYGHCPYAVPELETDVRATFDPRKNGGLEFSDVQPFVAYDSAGRVVGRIAGIVNHRANERWGTRAVRFSYIDFVDDPRVSAALLQTVEEWGRQKGMDLIQGPLGISDFDPEGMLIEGFDQQASLATLYNYPYYPRHLEAQGYEKEVDWLQLRVDIPSAVPPRYARVASLLREQFGLRLRTLTRRQLLREGYDRKVFSLLNEAYAPLFGYTALTDRQIADYVSRYLAWIDPRFLPLVENEAGELVGVAVTLRSLVPALRRSRGRLFPFGWVPLLKALLRPREPKAELLLIAVRPDHQGMGVSALFFDHLIPLYHRLGIQWAETGPQLETNIRELTQWRPLNPRQTKRRRCYRKKL
ncbi:MAG: N-acetyltransferase [Bacteroidaceae bacterium]